MTTKIASNQIDRGTVAIDLTSYGATYGSSATASANSAALTDAIAVSNVPISAPGECYLSTSELVGLFANQAYNYYTAALIENDDIIISNGRYHAKGRAVAGTYVEPMFATPRNSADASLERLTFSGNAFDVADDGNAVSNQRALYLTCVDGLRLHQNYAFTSGTRRGYFGHFHNIQNMSISGHLHNSVTGGFNFRYLSGMSFAGGTFADFSEAIDFDGISTNVAMSALSFNSSVSELDDQCMDLNSVTNSVITGVSAENVGNVYTINYKDTTQPNYVDFLAGTSPSALTPSSNVVINGVTALNAGKLGVASVIVGTTFSTEPTEGAVKRVILSDQIFENCGYFNIEGCEDLNMSNILLKDVISPASSSYAAISLRQDEVTTGTNLPVEATLINVSVDGCTRGALLTSGCRRLDIDGLRVTGADTSASGDYEVSLQSVPSTAVYTIDRLDVTGDLRISAASGAKIIWGPRNLISGSVVLQDSAHTCIIGDTENLYFGDIAATGTVKSRFVANRKCKVIAAYLVTSSTVAADGSNYRTATFTSVVSGASTTVSTVTSTGGWSANTRISGGFTVGEVAVDLAAGDAMNVSISHTGTGAAMNDTVVILSVMYL